MGIIYDEIESKGLHYVKTEEEAIEYAGSIAR